MTSNEGNAPVLKGTDAATIRMFMNRCLTILHTYMFPPNDEEPFLYLEGGGTGCSPPAGCKCAAPAPQLECNWSGMSDGLILQKNQRSQTRRRDPAGVAPSGIAAACLFDQHPQKNSWPGAFSLRRVELIAFSPALSQVPKWSHFTLISL